MEQNVIAWQSAQHTKIVCVLRTKQRATRAKIKALRRARHSTRSTDGNAQRAHARRVHTWELEVWADRLSAAPGPRTGLDASSRAGRWSCHAGATQATSRPSWTRAANASSRAGPRWQRAASRTKTAHGRAKGAAPGYREPRVELAAPGSHRPHQNHARVSQRRHAGLPRATSHKPRWLHAEAVPWPGRAGRAASTGNLRARQGRRGARGRRKKGWGLPWR